jgi:2-hydroxycyclohexanecarboxyl-CoA dehydrogenase
MGGAEARGLDLHLTGSVAVVIGGARGIGAAIAAEFGRQGASVAVLDVAPEVQQTAGLLARDTRAPIRGIQVDATDYAAVSRAATRVDTELGPCDHLVCAAGAGSGKLGFPFWNLEPGDWNRVIQINLMSAVHSAHAFAPGMANRGRGTLLFIASVAGQIGSQTDPPYSAAKAAVINFAQCAARDLAPFGVRANTVCPGMVKTDLNRSVWQAWNERQEPESRLSYEEWGEEKVRRVAPLGKWQQPEEIAAMAVYLASPHASNITGQTLNVDGGQVMRA